MNHSGPARPRSTYPTPGELENHRLKSAHLVGRNMSSLEGKWKYTVIKWEVITFFFNVQKWRVARLPTQGPGFFLAENSYIYYIVSICSICSFFDAWENEQTPIFNWSLQRRHVKKNRTWQRWLAPTLLAPANDEPQGESLRQGDLSLLTGFWFVCRHPSPPQEKETGLKHHVFPIYLETRIGKTNKN